MDATSALSHACNTPPVEGAGAGSLPVPYPGGAKKLKIKWMLHSLMNLAIIGEIMLHHHLYSGGK
jgi:hypothetical protein